MTARIIGAGTQAVARAPDVLRALGVGSCVVVSLWDFRHRVGGLAHLPLPTRPGPDQPVECYVDSGIERLLERLLEQGSARSDLQVKAAGGASLLISRGDGEHSSIGLRNLGALERTLEQMSLDLAGRDLGGRVARSVSLDTASGALRVASLRSAATLL